MATDNEVRSAVLRRFYEPRNERHGFYEVLVSDFADAYSRTELRRACDQLEQKNLIADWHPITVGEGNSVGIGKLSASGADVVEGIQPSPFAVANVSINNSQNVAIGKNNVQHWLGQFEALVKQIDALDASAADKQQAKSLLKSFLTHPLVVSVVGGVAGGLLG